MLFCDSRWQCFAWLVNLTAVAVYSLLSYLWCSTVDSIQFHVACCSTVSCKCRYITDISLVRLLLWNVPKCLPTNTHTICVYWGYCSSSIYRILLTRFLTPDGHCICTLNNYIVFKPCTIILLFPVNINPFPSLTLQSARNLKVPSPSKRSKAFLV